MSQSVSQGEVHLPVDMLLADYACGRLSASLHALVASHLELKPGSSAFVAGLEALHGGELEIIEGAGRDDAHRDRIAAIVDASPRIAGRHSAISTALPRSLHAFIGCDLPGIRWRTRLPGLREYRVETSDGLEASLLWIGAGRKMPSHTHKGSEITLVLQGAFGDTNGAYRRGDIAVADSEIDHAPRADADADCICFAVTDAPLRLTGPIGRVFSKLLGQ